MIREILGPEINDAIASLFEPCEEIYLVGGAVRDHLLRVPSHDIDFVVKKNALKAAKICADRLNGAYYALDVERGTGRALLEIHGEQIILDFATLTPAGIQADLALRDFTINAIAMDARDPAQLIDPMHGEADLKNGILRPCGRSSFTSDPIRTIRAVRFQQRLDLKIDRANEDLIRAAAPGLAAISAERKRDELFAVFESQDVKRSCLLMQDYQIWCQVFPLLDKLDQLKDVPRHFHSLEGHTLAVLDYCQQLITYIHDGRMITGQPFLTSACETLDEFRTDLQAFWAHPIHPARQYDGLLYLAVLYHDLSKTEIELQDEDGKIGYPGHAQKSADLFDTTRANWALSRDEFQFVDLVIRNHTLPAEIQVSDDVRSRKALHRFFLRSGSAGVMIAIFYLADILATYEDYLTDERWDKARMTCRRLLDCWFRKYDQIVAPPVLATGDDLMREFGLNAGPQIGAILADIQEEQAAGSISNKDEVLEFAARWLNEKERKDHGH
jgi:tRNA nucleotidyltransferase/poly(A) polymerase